MASARIALLIEGTRGDAQPCIALALGLQKAGHVVKFFTNSSHSDFVKGFGIDVVGCGFDFETWMRTNEAARELMKTGNFFAFLAAINSPEAMDLFGGSVVEYWKQLDDFKPELMLGGTLNSSITFLYEFQRRVPFIRAELQLNVPTDDWAPFGLPNSPPGTGENLKA